MMRLLIVSNRLPVSIRRTGNELEFAPSSGGLAAGLRGYHEKGRSLWIGWPGQPMRRVERRNRSADVRSASEKRLEAQLAEHALALVDLSAAEIAGYYEGFSNEVIWPLFHYLLDRIPTTSGDWRCYHDVNLRYADVVSAHYRPGDVIWVHDYHLMLLPAMLRERMPEAPVGFFLHIPFPAWEVLRALPWARPLVEGLLGADLVGFHTRPYAAHFMEAVREELGVEARGGRIPIDGREVRVDAFPMGADVERFQALSARPDVQAEAQQVREEAGNRRILLGIDRLDYTKGIPRRLAAFERLLERQPALRDRVRLIQVAVPSRDGVEHYQQFRRQIEQTVGRLNGAVGTLASAPIHYLHRSVSDEQLTGLYQAADVMLVTPIRDGMNLVAKEFVVSRPDESGVLVLSRFAGAAEELREAVQVNPYDIDGVATAIEQALTMSASDVRRRMRALRQRVIGNGVVQWAERFLAALTSGRTLAGEPAPFGALTARGNEAAI